MRESYFLYIISLFLTFYFASVCFALSEEQIPVENPLESDTAEIFPNIKPERDTFALRVITAYANKLELQPLKANYMRLFVQPVGIVLEAVDVNLVSGDLILYPGTHYPDEPRKTIINSKGLEELKAILKSEEFLSVPQQNNKIGADGVSDVIEVNLDGSYTWKIHWVTDDPNLISALYKINSIISSTWMYSYAQSKGIGNLRANHVRLFADVSPSNTYSITDIDLNTGKLIHYRKDDVRENVIDEADIKKLKQMLAAEEFCKQTPDSRSKLGANGKAYLIEYDIDGIYFRRIIPTLERDDEHFNNVMQQMNSLVYKE